MCNWADNNPEARREVNRKYRQRNSEKRLAYQREYRKRAHVKAAREKYPGATP